MSRSFALLCCGVLLGLARPEGRQAGADAFIAGVVVDAATNAPVRPARVSTVHNNRLVEIDTDEAGLFRLDGLSAGSYVLYVSAPGYLQTRYGASRPDWQGTPVRISAGQRLTGITIPLVRGAVISGRVTTPDGLPAADTEVRVLKWGYSGQTGDRELVAAGGGRSGTDDRGDYRLHGLSPGTYLIAATGMPLDRGGLQAQGRRPDDDVEIVEHDDVAAALDGRPVRPPRFAPHLRAAPTFYPGVLREDMAQAITIAAGEELTNIDFQIAMQPTATVSGRLLSADGAPIKDGRVSIFRTDDQLLVDRMSTRYGAVRDGRFEFPSLLPGEYVVAAQAGADPLLSATARVSVAGVDVPNVAILLESGVTVAGRVEIERGAPGLATFANLRIGVTAIVEKGEVNVAPGPVPIAADGQFRIANVAPGRYVIELTSVERWSHPADPKPWIKTAVVGGQDAADAPVTIGRDDISDVVVTISTQQTEVNGAVRLSAGEPASSSSVIVFSSEPAHWTRSRRVRAVSPENGRFVVSGLPSGRYLVAVADLEPGQSRNVDFLRQLAARAQPITLEEGRTVTIDLTAGQR